MRTHAHCPMLTYFIRSMKYFSLIQFHLVNVPSLSTADTIKTISHCIYSNLQHHFAGRKCKHKTIFHPLTRMNLSESRQNSRHNSMKKKEYKIALLSFECISFFPPFSRLLMPTPTRLPFSIAIFYALSLPASVCVCGIGAFIYVQSYLHMQIFSLDLMNRSSAFSWKWIKPAREILMGQRSAL